MSPGPALPGPPPTLFCPGEHCVESGPGGAAWAMRAARLRQPLRLHSLGPPGPLTLPTFQLDGKEVATLRNDPTARCVCGEAAKSDKRHNRPVCLRQMDDPALLAYV